MNRRPHGIHHVTVAIDERVASLSSALRLPPQFESRRAPIEARLRPLRSPRDVASHA
jgi:hypothetical protein